MTTPTRIVAEKARRLVDERRVFLSQPFGEAIVLGASGVWRVDARALGVWCNCPAGSNFDPASCSHKVAAQVAWWEAM